MSKPTTRLIGRQRLPRSAAGVISMVELLTVVLIISILLVMAVPTYERVKRRARAAALVNDFRVFGGVFQAYAHERGAWPAEVPAGVMPAGFTGDDLQENVWTNPTPIGGKFDWEYNQAHPGGTSPGGKWRAAVAITTTADSPLLVDADLYEAIDELLDDGNLATGTFRLGFGDCPIFILEP
ncbi:MAG: type II secretion system protein [Verrucomicrobiota bacterium]